MVQGFLLALLQFCSLQQATCRINATSCKPVRVITYGFQRHVLFCSRFTLLLVGKRGLLFAWLFFQLRWKENSVCNFSQACRSLRMKCAMTRVPLPVCLWSFWNVFWMQMHRRWAQVQVLLVSCSRQELLLINVWITENISDVKNTWRMLEAFFTAECLFLFNRSLSGSGTSRQEIQH